MNFLGKRLFPKINRKEESGRTTEEQEQGPCACPPSMAMSTKKEHSTGSSVVHKRGRLTLFDVVAIDSAPAKNITTSLLSRQASNAPNADDPSSFFAHWSGVILGVSNR